MKADLEFQLPLLETPEVEAAVAGIAEAGAESRGAIFTRREVVTSFSTSQVTGPTIRYTARGCACFQNCKRPTTDGVTSAFQGIRHPPRAAARAAGPPRRSPAPFAWVAAHSL
jgi:hypothetical protein